MKILHAGLAASSEEKADRFYCDILGLEKSDSRIIDETIIQTIFGINEESKLIHYRGLDIDYEIFVNKEFKVAERQLTHTCIKVFDLKDIVSKCRAASIKVIEVPKGSAHITFISDFDGNLFELKE